MVGQSGANGVGRFVPQDGIQRLRGRREGRRLRVRPVVQGNVDGPNDPENRPRGPSLDLGKRLIVVRHERDPVPQRAEPVLKFGQCPGRVEITRDTKRVAYQPIQVEGVVYIAVGRWCQAFDDMDEVGEEYAVAVGEVGLESVLRDVQLAHDNIGPVLVALLRAGGNCSGHALRGDGDIWVVVMAVCFRNEPKVKRPEYMRHRIVVRVPGIKSLVERDRKERG